MGCAGTAWAQGVQGGPCSAHTEGNDYLQCLLSPRAASPPPAVVPDPLGSAVRREGHEQAGPGNPLPSLLVCFLAKKSMILFNGSSKDCEIGLHQMETEPLGCVCMRTRTWGWCGRTLPQVLVWFHRARKMPKLYEFYL